RVPHDIYRIYLSLEAPAHLEPGQQRQIIPVELKQASQRASSPARARSKSCSTSGQAFPVIATALHRPRRTSEADTAAEIRIVASFFDCILDCSAERSH